MENRARDEILLLKIRFHQRFLSNIFNIFAFILILISDSFTGECMKPIEFIQKKLGRDINPLADFLKDLCKKCTESLSELFWKVQSKGVSIVLA